MEQHRMQQGYVMLHTLCVCRVTIYNLLLSHLVCIFTLMSVICSNQNRIWYVWNGKEIFMRIRSIKDIDESFLVRSLDLRWSWHHWISPVLSMCSKCGGEWSTAGPHKNKHLFLQKLTCSKTVIFKVGWKYLCENILAMINTKVKTMSAFTKGKNVILFPI